MESVELTHVKRVMTVLKNGEAARSEIAASWRRCMVVHNLDPSQPPRQQVLTQTEFRETIEEIEPLLHLAEPEVARLFRIVRGAGYLILVSNARGIAVAERSEEENCGPSGKRPMLGASWDEGREGTNGLGTALATRRLALVRKNDHLYPRNGDMVCAAAPIYNHCGSLAGAIDITTFRGDVADSYLPLALSVVADAARRIEARCFREAYPHSMILALSDGGPVGGSTPLVAVNSDQFVIGATHAARTSRQITDDMLSAGMPLGDFLPTINKESQSLADAERNVLRQTLYYTNNNISEAAAKLGISRTTMYRKLKRLENKGTSKKKYC